MDDSNRGSTMLVYVLALVTALCASACAIETDDDGDDEGGEVAQADSAITAGRLTTLAQNKAAYFLAVDTNYVWWTDKSAGKLQRVPRAGGDIVTFAKDLQQPAAVAVDSTSVYWAETGTAASPNCKIKTMLKSGGFAPRTIYEGPNGCVGLALDVDRVVFTNVARGTVMRVNKGGSGLTTLATGGQPVEVVTDGTDVYWTDVGTGEIKGTKGRSIIVLAKNQSPQSLVIAGDYVYWTNPINGTVRRSYRHASYDDWDFVETGVKTIASGQAGPTGIAANGPWIYWTNIGGGSLMRARNDGTFRTKLATIPVGALHLELEMRAPRNPPSAFWVSPGAGTVSKMDFYL